MVSQKIPYIRHKNVPLKNALIIAFLILSTIASATDYYISSSGNDANNGRFSSTPWKTIAKVNASSFSPGDNIFFKKGDTWREQLIVPSSGNAGAYIVFSSYGTGLAPKILGSTQATTWTNTTGNIWVSATSLDEPYLTNNDPHGNIYFIETNSSVTTGIRKAYTSDFANLTSENNWTWNAHKVYVYSTVDPDTRYNSIEAAQRLHAIFLNGKQYVEINGINMFYTQNTGVWETYPTTNLTGYILRNCEIAYIGYPAGDGFGSHVVYNNSLIENNIIHDCGRRGVSIYNYGTSTVRNIIVQNNTFYNGNHTTSVDIATGYGSLDNIIIRYNLIYDPPSSTRSSILMHAMNDNIDGTLTNLYIYYNIFKDPSPESIRLNGGINSAFIYNNTFYGGTSVHTGNPTHIYLADPYSVGDNVVSIKNNIFYSLLTTDSGGAGCGIYLDPVQDYKKVTADYNIYYRTNSSLRVIQSNSVSYHMNDISTIRSELGWETNSITPTDPLFVSTSNYRLQSTSNAIGTGTNVGLTTDYNGNTIRNPPSIGAYEYDSQQESPVIPVYQSSVIENATPSLLEITYNVSLANIVPASSAFTVQVNSFAKTVNTVAISGTKVLLTLASPIIYGDVVTVSYTKPSSNPLQTVSGGQAATISAQTVTNNTINVAPTAVITSPVNNSAFTSIANITITANASDADGSITMVEFYNGITKLGSKSATPYSFSWNNVAAGLYSLTVVATDNLNAKTKSSAISISVTNGTPTINQPPIVTISNPRKGNKYENPAIITIDAIASDPDGTISKVEFYNGAVKLVELTSAPYTYTWKDVAPGTYSITAIATDNLNATTTSSPIEFEVRANIKYDADSKIVNLYPNPNDGHFSIEFINPLQNEKSNIVITDLAGKQVYNSPVSKEETVKQFDLSNSKSGIYILIIIYKKILVTKKFIINNRW